MLKKAILGVDLGGTNIRVGRVEGSTITNEASCLVFEKGEGENEVVSNIIELIGQVITPEIEGIGMGIPSLLDRKRGIVYDVVNIPSWKRVELKSILENQFKIPVFLDNDANCFALGERHFGKGQNSENFVGMTLGTGLGSGIIKNGKIMSDKNCGSGEFGMIPYKDSIYENYCSSKFFTERHNTSGYEAFRAAEAGDPKSLNIFDELGFHIANAIKTVLYAVDPELIILGGSIAQANKYFHQAMLNELQNFPYSPVIENLKIDYSDLKNSAILGAAGIYLDNMNKQY